MAQFCTRKDCVAAIEKIIRQADKFVVLVTPYLDADVATHEDLENKARQKVPIYVILGKKEERKQGGRSLAQARGVKAIYREHLHAKCYMNESVALITSLNLYTHSLYNNDEMGVLVSSREEPDLYKEIRAQVRLWLGREGKKSGEPLAFCIRCRNSSVDRDPSKPYCFSCWKDWKREGRSFTNKEKHCHYCGKEYTTNYNKPLCIECFTNKPQPSLKIEARVGGMS